MHLWRMGTIYPPGTRRCFNVGRKKVGALITCYQRCSHVVLQTLVQKRLTDVESSSFMVHYTTPTCQVILTLLQREINVNWDMVDDEISNLVSTLHQRQESSIDPVCIFNPFSTPIQSTGGHVRRWFNVLLYSFWNQWCFLQSDWFTGVPFQHESHS
jgi:hypothetical protein